MNINTSDKINLAGVAESRNVFRKFQNALPLRILVKGFLISVKYLPLGLIRILLICILIFSCAKKQTIRQPELQPHTGPVTIEILKQSVGLKDIESIKSPLDVKIFRDGENAGSLNGVFAYKYPDRMRMSFFGPLGLTVTDIIISSDLLQTYIPSKNIIYEWRSPAVSFNGLRDSSFIYSMDDSGEIFILSAYKPDNGYSELVAEYIFDKKYLINRAIIFYKDGYEIIEVEFSDFIVRIPGRIDVFFPNGAAIEIFLKDPEFAAEIPDDYFMPVDSKDKYVMPFEDILKNFAPSR